MRTNDLYKLKDILMLAKLPKVERRWVEAVLDVEIAFNNKRNARSAGWKQVYENDKGDKRSNNQDK